MRIVFHPHAEGGLRQRQIARELVNQVALEPQQRVEGYLGRRIHQSKFFDPILSKEMLLRIVVEATEGQLLIMTVYKTSRIEKYWQGED